MKKDKAKAKAKAIKHVNFYREDLKFWQDWYVDACRSKISTMDVRLHHLYDGKTAREYMKQEAIEHMNEAKEKIARYERIAR